MIAKPTTKAKTAPSPGVIEANAAYTLPEFCRRARLAKWGMREARRRGLKVVRVGRVSYVLGADFLSFLASQSAAADGECSADLTESREKPVTGGKVLAKALGGRDGL